MALRAVAFAFAALVSAQAAGQQQPAAAANSLSGAEIEKIAVINIERVYQDSRMGRRIADELAAARVALISENECFDRLFEDEEHRISEEKPNLTESEFMERRVNFTKKVAARRNIQDAKEPRLKEWHALQSVGLRSAVSLVSEQIADEYELDLIVFSDAVAWHKRLIDVSDSVVRLLDEVYGNGVGGNYTNAKSYAKISGAAGSQQQDGTVEQGGSGNEPGTERQTACD